VPKDPVTSGNAEAGVFAYVQACAARSGRMSGSVDEAWTGSWSIAAGQARKRTRPPGKDAESRTQSRVPLQPQPRPVSPSFSLALSTRRTTTQ
jgi:hypothetical protein